MCLSRIYKLLAACTRHEYAATTPEQAKYWHAQWKRFSDFCKSKDWPV